jgi:hypothetical protein
VVQLVASGIDGVTSDWDLGRSCVYESFGWRYMLRLGEDLGRYILGDAFPSARAPHSHMGGFRFDERVCSEPFGRGAGSNRLRSTSTGPWSPDSLDQCFGRINSFPSARSGRRCETGERM